MIETQDLSLIAQYFHEQLKDKCIKSDGYHNHPPIDIIVHNCEYCKTYGK